MKVKILTAKCPYCRRLTKLTLYKYTIEHVFTSIESACEHFKRVNQYNYPITILFETFVLKEAKVKEEK
jgi:hypothetical protein